MKLQGFAFGLRISKSFYLEDKLGAITDELLYSKDSAFGPSLFPKVQEQRGAKVLFNPETQNRFTITHSDFILEYSIKNDFESEFNSYLDAFVKSIITSIFKKYNVHNISRFGFIIKAELEKEDEITTSVQDIIKKYHSGLSTDSYSLRFNVKKKTPLTIKNFITEDFDNTIVTYDRPNDQSKLSLSVDYQKYFVPDLNSINESNISFDSFCKKCYKKYKEDYLNCEKEQ